MTLEPTRLPPDARRFERRKLLGEPLALIEFQGSWFEDVPESNAVVPIPGVRHTKVKELVAGRFRKTKRSGDWIEVDKQVAGAHDALIHWCRRHCNSETPSGAFLFPPKAWEERLEDPLPIPFVPEFDHPSAAIRGWPQPSGTSGRRRRSSAVPASAATS